MFKSLNKRISLIGIIVGVVVVGLIGGGIYFYLQSKAPTSSENTENVEKFNKILSDIIYNEIKTIPDLDVEPALSITLMEFKRYLDEELEIPNLDAKLAEIDISQEEEELFFNIIETQFNNVGVKISKQELKDCCNDSLIKAFKFFKLVDDTRAKARDLRRKSELSQIRSAMEINYELENKYLQSKTMPTTMESLLGTSTVPLDILSKASYNWLDNTGNSTTNCNGQQYCIWAELEGGGYFIVSEGGGADVSVKPTECPCLKASKVNESQNKPNQNIPNQNIPHVVISDLYSSYDGSGTIKAKIKVDSTMIGRFDIINWSEVPITLKSVKLSDSGSHHGSSLRYSIYAMTEEGNLILLKTSTTDSLDFGYISSFTLNAGKSIYLNVVLSDTTGLVAGDTFKISMKSIGDITFDSDTLSGIPLFAYNTPVVCDTVISQ